MLQMKALNPMNTMNSAGQVTITIENQDQFLHLQNSYLLIEGNAAKSAIPYLILIAGKVASTIADAVNKRKRVDINAKHSQELQLKKDFVDTGGIDINALIDGSGYCIGLKR